MTDTEVQENSENVTKDEGPGIVCSVTGRPADVFIRNTEGRLVPLIRPLFERLKKGRENLLPLLKKSGKEEMAGWLDGSFEELTISDHSEEYWSQSPNVKEEKRRKRIEILKDLEIEIGLWSKQLLTDEYLGQKLKEQDAAKNIGDFKISRLEDYPKNGIHTVIVSNKDLDAESIKLIWNEQIKQNSSSN